MLSNRYRPGLCWARNCPILNLLPLRLSRKAIIAVGKNGRAAGLPSSYPENMIRWTAKFLLLVLLAGTFAPMAAAFAMAAQPSAMAMPADHCQRKPVAAPAMAGCHHHAAAALAEPARTPLAVRSGKCCDGHECCRSMVRTLWAQRRPDEQFSPPSIAQKSRSSATHLFPATATA